MPAPREIELFTTWSAHGFDDADERWEKHTLSVSDGNIKAIATLVVEVREQSTPRRGPPLPATVTTTQHEIEVEELVALIKKFGRSVP
jgi:hypothetical protein